jgi:hypothetical protein
VATINIKKTTLLFFLYFSLSNCSRNNDESLMDYKTNREAFYQSLSKIELPKDHKIIAKVDSDFISVAIIGLRKEDWKSFAGKNEFSPIKDTFPQTIVGLSFLDSAYGQLPDNHKLLRKRGGRAGTRWLYLLDTANCWLYRNFSYPNERGYTKPLWSDSYLPIIMKENEKIPN